MDGDVVRGPKQPFLNCLKCGITSNWACQLRCRCGVKAPKAVLKRAQGFANGDGGRGSGSKREARLEKQFADFTGNFEQLMAPARAPAQQGGGAGGAAGALADTRARTPLRTEAAQLEQTISACNGESAAAAKKSLEEQLKEVRANIEGRKPDLTQHSNVGHRLKRCKHHLSKISEDIVACGKRLEQAQKEKQDLETNRAAAGKEIAELQRQLVASLPLGGLRRSSARKRRFLGLGLLIVAMVMPRKGQVSTSLFPWMVSSIACLSTKMRRTVSVRITMATSVRSWRPFGATAKRPKTSLR
ncbi:unnamed protein product [Prorocentrum cordatum]|uniref:Uncharacterized protein n=1 Tax=Prorocentrum cordatum TaxID=2364126 RepID=A0ABN9T2T0_9DINO|nr:unnamed protein product [Polarella glacialis]